MFTLLAWLLGATSLLAGIVLAVVAIGQVTIGSGSLLLPSAFGAVAAFALAYACNRHIEGSRAAERKRLDVVPDPVPVPEGELALRMRWGRWLVASLVLCACVAFALWALPIAWQAGKPKGVIPLTFVVVVLAPASLLLLETGRRVLALGGIARLDAHGFRHCLLPPVPWKQVRGVDLELQVTRDIKQWHLVLAVDRALVPALRLPWWWRATCPGVPRVDDDGRLTVPLSYVRGKPQVVVGQAMSVADRWGAPRIPGWRSFLPPDLAASLHATTVSSQEANREMHRLMEQLRSPDKSGEEAERIMAQARRSMDEADRAFEEQMKLLRKGMRT